MNNFCIYCSEPIKDTDFVSLGNSCAHTKCFSSYLKDIEELTEFMDLDGGDYYISRDYFPNKENK